LSLACLWTVQADSTEDGRCFASVFGIVTTYSYITRKGKSHHKSCIFPQRCSDLVRCNYIIYIIKGDMLSVCLLPMAGQTAGPIKTKLGIGTHVDPGSVLGCSQGQGECHVVQPGEC